LAGAGEEWAAAEEEVTSMLFKFSLLVLLIWSAWVPLLSCDTNI
jgi:hypothetical protein